MTFNLVHFAEKYQHARETAINERPQSGVAGYELEWNLLDSQFHPLLTVGSGPSQQSFVDYLRSECLTTWLRGFSQLEVFHWMIEWVTRPYYTLRGAVYESRLLEGTLLNALSQAGRQFGERLNYWHGNLLFVPHTWANSIPGSWHIAKRRYLERCVSLYGDALATAGTHTNLSIPEPLFAWDFMHLPSSERGNMHLDEYRSNFYITATRLLRAFSSLFIATSASTPFQAQERDGKQVVLLTEIDSIRNITFPNPPAMDLPDLYRSYKDYLDISYDLVRRDIRFGNNNWMPVRARSQAEPVERLILVTSEQLNDLYARGLYSLGESVPSEEVAVLIEKQNLMARINLPMARVEIRTDDGGHPMEIELANLTFKHLLLLRFYADPEFARSFRYDREDISRARRNEDLAARFGLCAEIENPLTGKPIAMRDFLRWSLAELRPLAEALTLWDDLHPLVEMAAGEPNTAERMRERFQKELGPDGVVPLEILHLLSLEREEQVRKDVETIAASYQNFTGESAKLGEFIQRAREVAREDPLVPIHFQPSPEAVIETHYSDKTAEILDLAQQLIRIPSVTASPEERIQEVHRVSAMAYDYLNHRHVPVRFLEKGKYPAVLAYFPGQETSPVMLCGHVDVVSPDPDDSQFDPRIEGDYLWGRGAADMKTVVATYLVWMKDMLRKGENPLISLLLVGNEENGEMEPVGTPHALNLLGDFGLTQPKFFIAGERTGEKGNELWGEICIQNRGIMRFDVIARGRRSHSGVTSVQTDMTERLFNARIAISKVFEKYLTVKSTDGWQSQTRNPFVQVGTPGVYNITADYGRLGYEVRPIPQDNVDVLRDEIQAYTEANNLELQVSVMENGIACDPKNPYLLKLIEAVRNVSGQEPVIGRKLPGTSARFAPNGQGVVWGQTGIGPHTKDERHFIPSILPYYQALQSLAEKLKE
jgi:succinyl-diaminopimelate desuccinylase